MPFMLAKGTLRMQALEPGLFAFFAAAVLALPEARAHPLQAAPLDHAHVPAFEQFYLPEDDDAFLSEGGLLLLAELNCAACHPAPAAWGEWVGRKPGPDLSRVGSRLGMDALWRFIRSPQHRKPGTQMPGLFAGNEEADPDVIEALATYLASLKAPAVEAKPNGDARRGRELYHQVGCVACHEPAADYRPPSLPAEADPEAPGLPSSPLALADDYDEGALAAFLRDPLAFRPASRMPDQHLSAQEAADLAAYLHLDRRPAVFQERQILGLAPRSVAEGRALFVKHRCAACHETGEALAPAAVLPPLERLAGNGGCLSGELRSGVPRYDLSPLQIRALRLALPRLQQPPDAEPAARLGHQLARLNCYACHDHDGRGGPEIARAPYFTPVLRRRPNDDLENLPPSLDGLRQRLSAEQVKVRLTQPAPLSERFSVRMPRFDWLSVRSLAELLRDSGSQR